MVADIFLAAYIKVDQDGGTSKGASEAALAFIFIQAFGYTTGEYTPISLYMSELTVACRPFDSALCSRE